MADPRLDIIGRRLEEVGKIIAVTSGKGGVGKSVIASTLALCLKDRGYKVGLLDLDFTSPSTHVILGIEGIFPEERYGIEPPLAHGLRYMTITYYTLNKPAPLRGTDVSDAIIELLSVIRWGKLDFLVVDMPPGIGDAILDIIRLTQGINFLVVTTPSRLAFETVRKQLTLFQGLNTKIIGVVENIVMKPSSLIRKQVEEDNIFYLGTIWFDPELEKALGDIEKLSSTTFYKSVSELVTSME